MSQPISGKPRILVLYYTQTGQLRDILNSITAPLAGKAELTFAEIKPVTPFPFPWTATTFFDAMPECVVQEPIPVHPLPADIAGGQYDLVVLGYQPWFLHPSLPVSSWLQSGEARLLSGKKVITVIGSRNMWLNAQERVKEHLHRLGATLAGNIVLADTNPNLTSLLTVIRWSFKGRKAAGRWLPAAGVQDADIRAANRFGHTVLAAALSAAESVDNTTGTSIQQQLQQSGAVPLKPGLVVLEQRGIKNFRFWAQYIRRKGKRGDPARLGRVKLFQRLLLTAIFILSPISSFTAFLKRHVHRRQLSRDVTYFRGVGFETGRM